MPRRWAPRVPPQSTFVDTTILRVLRSHSAMRRLTADDLQIIAAHTRSLCHLPGAYLFREGQPRRAFGILLKGRADVFKGSAAARETLYMLGPGDSWGEGSLLDDYPHSTSGIVTEPMEVLEIPRVNIDALMNEHPHLYSRLVAGAAQTIAMRLRAANARLAGRAESYISGELRREKDLLGEREVPDSFYYGIQTLRAVENFPITGIPIAQYPAADPGARAVKEAAALANRDLGLLDPTICRRGRRRVPGDPDSAAT
jgi:aspartate ammonia-lyase